MTSHYAKPYPMDLCSVHSRNLDLRVSRLQDQIVRDEVNLEYAESTKQSDRFRERIAKNEAEIDALVAAHHARQARA